MVPPTELPPLAIELWIDSRLDNLDLLGGAVSGIASVLGFAEVERYHLELCAVEAVTNSIRHAYHGAPGQPVRVQIVAGAERIELRIADLGTPVPEERRKPPPDVEVDPAAPENIKEGGRGLFLMYTLMDEVSFALEDGWNIVAFKKRRPAA
jgi:serine/threonine-protein kinase RsbW